MKILYLTNSMDIGGVETSLVGLSRTLRRLGHDVCVGSSGGALVADLERDGTRHIRLPLGMEHPLQLGWTMWRMARWLERNHFDVVHSMSAAGNLATAFVSRHSGLRTRFFTSPMGLQNSTDEAAAVTLMRLWLHTFRADTILLISEQIEHLVRLMPLSRSRLLYCNVNGIDCDRFGASTAQRHRIRDELGIGEHEPLITTIGALHPRKSHDLFLECAARVLTELPTARFLIVGDGHLRPLLEAQIERLGIEERVKLAGARQDVPEILAATDAYVKPGIVEGFIGITVLEAMAARKPVLAFDTRDVREAIADGLTGVIVPSPDVSAMAKAILDVLRNTGSTHRMVDRAAAHVTRRFGLTAVAQNVETVYRRETRLSPELAYA